MTDLQQALLADARSRYGEIQPCAGRRSLEECFADYGKHGFYLYFNDKTGSTHVVRAAADSNTSLPRPLLDQELQKRREESRERSLRWRLAHPEKTKEVNRQWRLRHPEYKEIERQRRLRNLDKARESRKKWREAHPEKEKERVKKWRRDHRELCKKQAHERRKILHQKVIDVYGGKCAICGESEYNRLTLDHANGDGGEFRRPFKEKNRTMSGSNFYYWLRKKSFPKNLGLRVLCISCNQREWWKRKSA